MECGVPWTVAEMSHSTVMSHSASGLETWVLVRHCSVVSCPSSARFPRGKLYYKLCYWLSLLLLLLLCWCWFSSWPIIVHISPLTRVSRMTVCLCCASCCSDCIAASLARPAHSVHWRYRPVSAPCNNWPSHNALILHKQRGFCNWERAHC